VGRFVTVAVDGGQHGERESVIMRGRAAGELGRQFLAAPLLLFGRREIHAPLPAAVQPRASA
jgi:hypothetical protein